MLEYQEGFRSRPYRDTTGHLTIGIGWNLDAGITLEQARYILSGHIDKALKDCQDSLPWFQRLDAARQLVIVNMAFNMGLYALRGFVNTLGHVARGEYEQAADRMLRSLWARQVGQRARDLSRIMRTGVL